MDLGNSPNVIRAVYNTHNGSITSPEFVVFTFEVQWDNVFNYCQKAIVNVQYLQVKKNVMVKVGVKGFKIEAAFFKDGSNESTR